MYFISLYAWKVNFVLYSPAAMRGVISSLLQKDAPFIFDNKCITYFEQLKAALVTTPIIRPPNWKQPFE
jgi:hypothetical protein